MPPTRSSSRPRGDPRLRAWLDRVKTESMLEAAVVYGYFPCWSEGDDLVVLQDDGVTERCRFTFPRQRRDRHLCLSDFFRSRESGEVDVVGFHVVTMGNRVSEAANELFAADAYRDYLELHGLVGPADRGARGVLACPGAQRARLRRRGLPGPGRGLPSGLPRIALLLRLSRPVPTSRTRCRSWSC